VFGIANQAGVKLGSAGSAVLHGRTAGRADPG
jgi:hypothetical protein